MNAPLLFRWEGDAMKPAGAHQQDRCDKEYVVGQTYRLMEWEERSDVSHKHQFAWLKEAWDQLPDDLKDLYPTTEHLRKRALIEAGFYDEEAIDAGTNAAALRVAASARRWHEFSLVIVRGPIVLIRTPKSQSRRKMNAKDFQRSKESIMEIVAEMIGVSPDQLREEAGKAA